MASKCVEGELLHPYLVLWGAALVENYFWAINATPKLHNERGVTGRGKIPHLVVVSIPSPFRFVMDGGIWWRLSFWKCNRLLCVRPMTFTLEQGEREGLRREVVVVDDKHRPLFSARQLIWHETGQVVYDDVSMPARGQVTDCVGNGKHNLLPQQKLKFAFQI